MGIVFIELSQPLYPPKRPHHNIAPASRWTLSLASQTIASRLQLHRPRLPICLARVDRFARLLDGLEDSLVVQRRLRVDGRRLCV